MAKPNNKWINLADEAVAAQARQQAADAELAASQEARIAAQSRLEETQAGIEARRMAEAEAANAKGIADIEAESTGARAMGAVEATEKTAEISAAQMAAGTELARMAMAPTAFRDTRSQQQMFGSLMGPNLAEVQYDIAMGRHKAILDARRYQQAKKRAADAYGGAPKDDEVAAINEVTRAAMEGRGISKGTSDFFRNTENWNRLASTSTGRAAFGQYRSAVSQAITAASTEMAKAEREMRTEAETSGTPYDVNAAYAKVLERGRQKINGIAANDADDILQEAMPQNIRAQRAAVLAANYANAQLPPGTGKIVPMQTPDGKWVIEHIKPTQLDEAKALYEWRKTILPTLEKVANEQGSTLVFTGDRVEVQPKQTPIVIKSAIGNIAKAAEGAKGAVGPQGEEGEKPISATRFSDKQAEKIVSDAIEKHGSDTEAAMKYVGEKLSEAGLTGGPLATELALARNNILGTLEGRKHERTEAEFKADKQSFDEFVSVFAADAASTADVINRVVQSGRTGTPWSSLSKENFSGMVDSGQIAEEVIKLMADQWEAGGKSADQIATYAAFIRGVARNQGWVNQFDSENAARLKAVFDELRDEYGAAAVKKREDDRAKAAAAGLPERDIASYYTDNLPKEQRGTGRNFILGDQPTLEAARTIGRTMLDEPDVEQAFFARDANNYALIPRSPDPYWTKHVINAARPLESTGLLIDSPDMNMKAQAMDRALAEYESVLQDPGDIQSKEPVNAKKAAEENLLKRGGPLAAAAYEVMDPLLRKVLLSKKSSMVAKSAALRIGLSTAQAKRERELITSLWNPDQETSVLLDLASELTGTEDMSVRDMSPDRIADMMERAAAKAEEAAAYVPPKDAGPKYAENAPMPIDGYDAYDAWFAKHNDVTFVNKQLNAGERAASVAELGAANMSGAAIRLNSAIQRLRRVLNSEAEKSAGPGRLMTEKHIGPF